MKKMKVILFTLLLVVFGQVTKAQFDTKVFGATLHGMQPIGEFANTANTGIGGTAHMLAIITEGLLLDKDGLFLNIGIGYLNFSEKSLANNIQSKYSMIPLYAGLSYSPVGILGLGVPYIGLDAGGYWVFNNTSVLGQNTSSNEITWGVSPKIGLTGVMSLPLDVCFKYNQIKDNAFLSLCVAWNIIGF
jgi:hypothetical protein